MAMNPLPSSWTKERRAAFCESSMSSSPVVKKATASKSSRFLACRPSFFLVTSWQSVRMTVSHRPVSWPSFHKVAAASEMDSCCHPLLSPMNSSRFLGCWALREIAMTTPAIRTGANRITSMPCTSRSAIFPPGRQRTQHRLHPGRVPCDGDCRHNPQEREQDGGDQRGREAADGEPGQQRRGGFPREAVDEQR